MYTEFPIYSPYYHKLTNEIQYQVHINTLDINLKFFAGKSLKVAQFISPPQYLLLFFVGVPPTVITNNSDTFVQIHPSGNLYVILTFSIIQFLQCSVLNSQLFLYFQNLIHKVRPLRYLLLNYHFLSNLDIDLLNMI